MAKTKVFWDMEFSGLHKLTTPISIGLVAEDGRKYYAEFTDFDKFQIDEFLKQVVLPRRILADFNMQTDYDPNAEVVLVKGDIDVVYSTLLDWFKPYEQNGVEMWGDLLAYDWVLFISIFGNGHNLPKFIDYIPMDLCTALKLMGEDKDIDRDVFAYGEEVAAQNKDQKHNALYDATTQMEVFKKLVEKSTKHAQGEEEVEEEGQEVSDEVTEHYQEEAETVKNEAEIHEEIVDNTPAEEEEEEVEEEREHFDMTSQEEIEEEKEDTTPPMKKAVEEQTEKKSEEKKAAAKKKAGRPPKKKVATKGEKKSEKAEEKTS